MSEFTWLIPSAVEPTAPSAASPGAVDHVALAVDRLRAQYRDKQTIVDLLSSLAGEFQPIEEALVQLRDERSIDNATGATLAKLARIVGVDPALFSDDETLRRVTRARVAINRSAGTGEDLIRVIRALLGDADVTISVRHEGDLCVAVYLVDAAVDAEVAELVATYAAIAVGAAVTLNIVYTSEVPAFTFDGPAMDGALAFADAI